MEEFLQAVANIFQYVCATFFILALCALPPAALVLAYSKLGLKPGQDPIQELANQMGLQPVALGRGRRFEGRHEDHIFTIGPGLRGYHAGGSRHYSPALSVHLELQTREPVRGRVGRSGGPPRIEATFETAFRQEAPIERLSPVARASMLRFVTQHGNLWLEAFRPKTTPRLEHTINNITRATPQSVRAILDNMLETARVIETTM